jgi:hypothetical protein
VKLASMRLAIGTSRCRPAASSRSIGFAGCRKESGRYLRFCCRRGGQPVHRDEISEATGYKRSSRDTYLQRLRSRMLVKDDGRGGVRASENLFA